MIKYTAPRAEVIELEISSVLLLSNLFCIIYDENNPECEDKLPDFYE